MAKLAKALRERYQNSTKIVFEKYLQLNILNFESFSVQNKENGDIAGTLKDVIFELAKTVVNNSKEIKNLTIGEETLDVEIEKKADGKISVKFDVNDANPDFSLKSLNEYTLKEKLSCLNEQTFNLDVNGDKKSFATTLEIDGEHKLGGVKLNKDNIPFVFDLYPQRLDELFKMYQKIANAKDDNDINFVVALATGSGKTYSQALQYLINKHAKIKKTIFCVPEDDVLRIKDDFSLLLPDSIINNLNVYKNGDAFNENKDYVASHKSLFTLESYKSLRNNLEKLKPEEKGEYFIAVDEVHAIEETEVASKRLEALKEDCFLMALTATPSRRVFDSLGKPDVTMSLKEKIENGQGKFPQFSFSKVESVDDFLKDSDFNIFSKTFNKLLAKMSPYSSNLGIELLHKINTSFYVGGNKDALDKQKVKVDDFTAEEKVRHFLRWNFHKPATNPLMVLTDNQSDAFFAGVAGNPLMSKYLLLNLKDNIFVRKMNPIKEGESLQDYEKRIAEKMVIAKQYMKIVQKNNESIKKSLANMLDKNHESYNADFKEAASLANIDSADKLFGMMSSEMRIGNEQDDFHQQRRLNFGHNMLELLLIKVCGMNTIELDEARFNDKKGFVEKAEKSFKDFFDKIKKDEEIEGYTIEGKSKNYFKEYFEKSGLYGKINKKFMDDKCSCLALICREINKNILIKDNAYNTEEEKKQAKEMLSRIFDNSFLDRKLGSFFEKDFLYQYNSGFESFENREKNVSKEDKLLSLRSKYSLPGFLRFKNILKEECIDNLSHNDLNLEERDVAKNTDNFFKNFFLNTFVNNYREKAYSNINLQRVGYLINKDDDKLNKPSSLIQGFGRLRGLRPRQIPFFFQIAGNDVDVSFSIENLKKGDYFDELLKGEERFAKHLVASVAKNLSQELILTLDKNVDKKGALLKNVDALVYDRIADALRQLNTNTVFNLDIAKIDMKKVSKLVKQDLKEHLKKLKNPGYYNSWYNFGISSAIRIGATAVKAKNGFLNFGNYFGMLTNYTKTSLFGANLKDKDGNVIDKDQQKIDKLWLKVMHKTSAASISDSVVFDLTRNKLLLNSDKVINLLAGNTSNYKKEFLNFIKETYKNEFIAIVGEQEWDKFFESSNEDEFLNKFVDLQIECFNLKSGESVERFTSIFNEAFKDSGEKIIKDSDENILGKLNEKKKEFILKVKAPDASGLTSIDKVFSEKFSLKSSEISEFLKGCVAEQTSLMIPLIDDKIDLKGALKNIENLIGTNLNISEDIKYKILGVVTEKIKVLFDETIEDAITNIVNKKPLKIEDASYENIVKEIGKEVVKKVSEQIKNNEFSPKELEGLLIDEPVLAGQKKILEGLLKQLLSSSEEVVVNYVDLFFDPKKNPGMKMILEKAQKSASDFQISIKTVKENFEDIMDSLNLSEEKITEELYVKEIINENVIEDSQKENVISYLRNPAVKKALINNLSVFSPSDLDLLLKNNPNFKVLGESSDKVAERLKKLLDLLNSNNMSGIEKEFFNKGEQTSGIYNFEIFDLLEYAKMILNDIKNMHGDFNSINTANVSSTLKRELLQNDNLSKTYTIRCLAKFNLSLTNLGTVVEKNIPANVKAAIESFKWFVSPLKKQGSLKVSDSVYCKKVDSYNKAGPISFAAENMALNEIVMSGIKKYSDSESYNNKAKRKNIKYVIRGAIEQVAEKFGLYKGWFNSNKLLKNMSNFLRSAKKTRKAVFVKLGYWTRKTKAFVLMKGTVTPNLSRRKFTTRIYEPSKVNVFGKQSEAFASDLQNASGLTDEDVENHDYTDGIDKLMKERRKNKA